MSDTHLLFPEPPKLEATPSYRAFAVSETFAEMTMLDVRLKTGSRIALPYSWLGKVIWSPPEMMLLFTTGAELYVRGRFLDELYSSVVRHQCVFVCEADRPTQLLAPEGLPVIESMEVKP